MSGLLHHRGSGGGLRWWRVLGMGCQGAAAFLCVRNGRRIRRGHRFFLLSVTNPDNPRWRLDEFHFRELCHGGSHGRRSIWGLPTILGGDRKSVVEGKRV